MEHRNLQGKPRGQRGLRKSPGLGPSPYASSPRPCDLGRVPPPRPRNEGFRVSRHFWRLGWAAERKALRAVAGEENRNPRPGCPVVRRRKAAAPSPVRAQMFLPSQGGAEVRTRAQLGWELPLGPGRVGRSPELPARGRPHKGPGADPETRGPQSRPPGPPSHLLPAPAGPQLHLFEPLHQNALVAARVQIPFPQLRPQIDHPQIAEPPRPGFRRGRAQSRCARRTRIA